MGTPHSASRSFCSLYRASAIDERRSAAVLRSTMYGHTHSTSSACAPAEVATHIMSPSGSARTIVRTPAASSARWK